MNLPYAKKIDSWLALTVFGLMLFGVVMIYSSSVIVGHTLFLDDKHFVKRQLMWSLLGSVGLLITANIDYRVWKRWAGWMLGITLLLLVSVFFFSKGEINGAHRWISIGGQTFQPSELAKLTFIIYASAWLVQRQKQIASIKETFLPYLGVLLVISVLMLMQPDFGTLTIILAGAIAVYYAAGLTWKQVLIGTVVMGLGAAIVSYSSPYRRDRLLTFLNPARDPKGASYHVKNISIAIGSGGWDGLGFGESRQKRLFLPEPQTDSIYAIIVEELGFIWGAIIIFLLCFIAYRGLIIASLAPDLFGSLIAVGITAWISFQTFINLASMLNLVPLVGVPLPFISYGGTNLVILLIATGILLNISRHGHDKEP